MNGEELQSQSGLFSTAWLLTRLCLWLCGIVAPLMLVLGIYTFIAGDPEATLTVGTPVIFMGQKIAWVLLWLLITVIAFSYILVYRKRSTDRDRISKTYMILMWLVIPLVVLPVSAHYKEAFYEKVLEDMDVIDVTISVVDAETGERISTFSVGYPSAPAAYREIDQKLPQCTRSVSDSRMRVTRLAAWPVTLRVGSDGYETKEFKVPSGPATEVEVRLTKAKNP